MCYNTSVLIFRFLRSGKKETIHRLGVDRDRPTVGMALAHRATRRCSRILISEREGDRGSLSCFSLV